jgi:PTS system N-acetylglucosamine-specific IIC component
MLPIAVLPIAGLLLRMGQPDLLNISFIASAGDSIFSNLGLIFAIGVAVGYAKDNNGAAGLAGAICFLVAVAGAKTLLTLPQELIGTITLTAFREKALMRLTVPIGILSGLSAGYFYNHYSAIALPDYLSFFGGKRFVPIISGIAGLLLALIFGLGWDSLSRAVDALSYLLVESGPLGLFIYGFLNRIFIITGLHHILNNVVWFIVGNYEGVSGDLHRFFAGDPSAGIFMTGFFPVMMFGLPAACFAMYQSAKTENKARVSGLFFSMAMTAFLTGVTEPIEFTFMFLAPTLYIIHAFLTGFAMMIMDYFGVKLGFGFSAGLFDYILNYGKATKPLYLIPIGLGYSLIYYALFRICITIFQLKTPGREDDEVPIADKNSLSNDTKSRGYAFIEAIGGSDNVLEIGACTTRLRLKINDKSLVNERLLKTLGSRGIIWPSPHDLQIIVGGIADSIASEIRSAFTKDIKSDDKKNISESLINALGNIGNIKTVECCSSRLSIEVHSSDKVNYTDLQHSIQKGFIEFKPQTFHFIFGLDAFEIYEKIKGKMG